MMIEVDEQQRTVLADLVGVRLSNLSSEVRHTYSPVVRRALRDEREALRGLAAQLGPVEALEA